ncbi:MAG: ABC transporter substrate-binding protein [Planctomycetales bacterium]|nr:ABC transporter substrate-binding protein [Planctomycetales bacterium]
MLRLSLFNFALLSFFAASFFGLMGCGGGAKSGGEKDALIYAQSDDPKTLDPINTDIAEAVHVITNVFDTLVTYDDVTTDLVPSLAESWKASDDGLSWTFKLRPGVQFHDGTPCNAAAVKLTFDRLLVPLEMEPASEEPPASGKPQKISKPPKIDKPPPSEPQKERRLLAHPHVYDAARPYQSAYSMIQTVETPDDLTVVFKLKYPSAIFLNNLAMFPASISSPAGLEEFGRNFAEHPVGTGPFKFVKWSRGQQLVLERFDGHWRGPAKIKTLIVVPVQENATRMQRLERGEIHIAEGLSPAELDVLSKNDKLIVQSHEAMNVAYLTMNVEKSPLGNKKVREAIALAIDKPALLQVGYGGNAKVGVSMVPPTIWGHDATMKDRPFDLAKAKTLMEEAAKEEGFKLPIKLELSVMNQARIYLQQPLPMAKFFKDSLAPIGIDLSIRGRDVSEHFRALMAGEHQLGFAGWNSDNNDPDNFLYSLVDQDNISEAGNNLSRFRSDKLHSLLIAGQKEMDKEKRLKIYSDAQQLILDEVPVVPLAHTQIRTAHVKGLAGFQLHTTALVRFRNAYFEATP